MRSCAGLDGWVAWMDGQPANQWSDLELHSWPGSRSSTAHILRCACPSLVARLWIIKLSRGTAGVTVAGERLGDCREAMEEYSIRHTCRLPKH